MNGKSRANVTKMRVGFGMVLGKFIGASYI